MPERSLVDVLNGPPRAEISIDGMALTRFDLLKLEAKAQRRALRLLKSKLHPSRIEELVAPEIEESDRRFREYAARQGEGYRPAIIEAEVVGLDRPAYAQWMFGSGVEKRPWSDYVPLPAAVANSDNPHEIFGHPEHYRLTHGHDGRHYEVETVGGLPVCWYIQFSSAPDVGGTDPVWPASSRTGELVLRDGTWAAYAGHRWIKTEAGMRARLAIYYSDGVPDEIIESMERHLCVEFNLWFTMAMLDYGTLKGHIDDYIGGTPGMKFRVADRDISAEEQLSWEVTAMRRALTLLRARLSPEELEDLVGVETAEADRRLRDYGFCAETELRSAEIRVRVPGISLKELQAFEAKKQRSVDDWAVHLEAWHGPVRNTDAASVLLSHPAHLRTTLQSDGSVREVSAIDGLPMRSTRSTPDLFGIKRARSADRGTVSADVELRDGTGLCARRCLFRDDADGCEGTVFVGFSAAVPKDVVDEYRAQLAVQIDTWIKMAAWELKR